MLARLRQVARELDLPFGERKMTFNSRLAQELGKWAEDQGRGDAFHHAVFLAYFQRGENIARQTGFAPDMLGGRPGSCSGGGGAGSAILS